jgi:chromosome segregation ATPase
LHEKNIDNSSKELVDFFESLVIKDKDLKSSVECLLGNYESKFTILSDSLKELEGERSELRRQLVSCLEEVKTIRDELERASEVASKKTLECRNLVVKAESQEKTIAGLKAALDSSNSASKSEHLTPLIDHLKADLRRAENSMHDLQRSAKRLDQEKSTIQSELSDKTKTVETISAENVRLKNQSQMLAHFESEYEASCKRLKELEIELANRNEEYQAVFANYCKLLKENEKLYNDNVQVTRGIKHLRYAERINC